MAELVLPCFVVGPTPEGRGYGMLAGSGLPRDASWQGSFPLVLLEWAKLRSRARFSGRFAVAGGAILVRAVYLGEGSAGPIAHANGFYVAQDQLEAVLAQERAVFRHLPEPSGSGSFGQVPLQLSLPDPLPPRLVEGLGLAWADRHVLVDEPLGLDEAAFALLESIDPPSQRQRLLGWCTTGLLAARGDFLPLQTVNLLVTRTTEPVQEARFLVARLTSDGTLSIEQRGAAPASYHFWQRLCALARTQILAERASEAESKLGWTVEMAEWTLVSVAWHFVGQLSSFGLSYAVMADAITAIGAEQSPETSAAGAEAMVRYLRTVAEVDHAALPDLAAAFRARLPAEASWHDHFHDVVIDLWPGGLVAAMNHDALLSIIRRFCVRTRDTWQEPLSEAQRAARRAIAVERISALAECSHTLSIKGRENLARRGELSLLARDLGLLSKPGDRAVGPAEARKLFRRRLTIPAGFTSQG